MSLLKFDLNYIEKEMFEADKLKLQELKNIIKEIIDSNQMIKSIEKYVEWNKWEDLSYVIKNAPLMKSFKEAGQLYRGMILIDNELNKLQNEVVKN